jgi:cysteine desulfurase
LYLDNSATTPLSKEVKEYIIDILDEYHNPSSTYQGGANAKAMIEQARSNVAKFINADVDDIYFTSGGAASNTLAIKGYYQRNGGFILYSPIAHKSILKCVENYKYAYSLKVDNNGIIDQSDLREWLDITNNKPLVVVDYANGEIGTIQDVKSIIDIIHILIAPLHSHLFRLMLKI